MRKIVMLLLAIIVTAIFGGAAYAADTKTEAESFSESTNQITPTNDSSASGGQVMRISGTNGSMQKTITPASDGVLVIRAKANMPQGQNAAFPVVKILTGGSCNNTQGIKSINSQTYADFTYANSEVTQGQAVNVCVKGDNGFGSGQTADVDFVLVEDGQAEPPPPSSDERVFAHYMLCCSGHVGADGQVASVPTYKEEIQLAKDAGIDGFALNAGEWDADGSGAAHYKIRADLMYQAAEEAGDFKLFFSADLNGPISDVDARDMVKRYVNSPAQMKVDNRSMLSTFGGEASSFGYANPTIGWKQAILDPLAAQGAPVYFVPGFYPETYSEDPSLSEWQSIYDRFPYVDGLFYFAAIGTPTVADSVAANSAGKQAAENNGKVFMAGWSGNYSPTSRHFEHQGYKGMEDMWEGIIADDPDYVEAVTWNDFNEASYIGPNEGGAAPAAGHAIGFPHDGFLELSERYAEKLKTGTYGATDSELFISHRAWTHSGARLYATSSLTTAGQVCLKSGGAAEQCFTTGTGVQNFDVALNTGTQTVTLKRNGSVVKQIVSPRSVGSSATHYNVYAEGK